MAAPPRKDSPGEEATTIAKSMLGLSGDSFQAGRARVIFNSAAAHLLKDVSMLPGETRRFEYEVRCSTLLDLHTENTAKEHSNGTL